MSILFTVLLLFVQVLVQTVLLAVIIAGVAFVFWALWDVTLGPSARMAATARARRRGARPAREVNGW